MAALIASLIAGLLFSISAHGMSDIEWRAIGPEAAGYEVGMNGERSGTANNGSRSGLTYINERTTDEVCGRPLSIEEKVLQQQLRAHPDWMRRQGVRDIGNSDYLSSFQLLARRAPWALIWMNSLIKVRDAAWVLEDQIFPRSTYSRINDEADAFRHFYSTARLLIMLGRERTEQILYIHEISQRDLGTLMDLYNNQQALDILAPHTSTLRLKKSSDLDQIIYQLYLNSLENGALVVLSPVMSSTPKPNTQFYAWAHKRLREPLPQ